MPFLPVICWIWSAAAVLAADDPAVLAGRGEFAQAAGGYAGVAAEHHRRGRLWEAVAGWCNAASCLKMTGDISAAAQFVRQAEAILPADAPADLRLELLALKGSVGALGKRPWDALPALEAAERQARAAGRADLHADLLNDLGIVHGALGEHRAAADCFEQAEAAGQQLGDRAVVLRARQNHVVAAFEAWQTADGLFAREEDLKSAEERQFEAFALQAGESLAGGRDDLAAAGTVLRQSLARARSMLAAEPPSILAAHLAITTGLAAHRHGWNRDAFDTLTRAVELAHQLADRPLEAEALLALAEVYLDIGRAGDALQVLDGARRAGRGAGPVQAARLELLAARCHMTADPLAPATAAAVLRAVAAVEPVRSDIARTQPISDLGRPFRERAGKPYLLLADLALRLARHHPHRARELAATAGRDLAALRVARLPEDPAEAAGLLARNALEAFKAWELQDFYRDDCVNVTLAKQRTLDQLGDDRTAALYVILLEARVEILLGLRGRIHRATSPAGGEAVLAAARRLRARIQSNDGTFLFLDDAEFLYQALIAPVVGELGARGVRHLVFVPDGALANIPLGVLFDRGRERFLLEDFSVSVAPGLALTPAEPASAEPPRALLGGLGESVGGFAPLPAARRELAALGAIYPSHVALVDAGFTKDALARGVAAADVTTIHLATHGEFQGRADRTFVLCHDGPVSLDELERMILPKKFLGQPVDLLCLSACQTAAGDDRAALGLAGAAVKSGSRAVLATLWYVDDAATSEIMTSFHRQRLRRGGATTAEALRQAQLAILRRVEPFEHPNLWAPFVLVGDWQ